jgi:holo-[acyl-carrier protein] synthase
LILGLGVDLVEVARIRAAMRNPRFLERILTIREMDEGMTAERVAGRWAAKEAVAKAVGTFLKWHDVEISNLPSGKPVVTISPAAYNLNGKSLHVSISHVKGQAVAVAILESKEVPK